MFSSSASAHGHALILPALMICHDIDGICLPLCNTTIGTSSDCVKMRRLVAKRIHEGYHIEKTIYIYMNMILVFGNGHFKVGFHHVRVARRKHKLSYESHS